jgi:predicted acylesterase/phospholipase RssA/CRP-like cAMP-binding protein
MTIMSVADALRASPTFRGLPEPWLTLLARAAAKRAFEPGEELETETGPDATPSLYLLTAGEVSSSTAPDAEGISEVVGTEGPGGVFGSAAITGEEEVPVFRALTPVEAYAWEEAALERLYAGADDLRRQLETRLSLRRRRNELVDLLRRTPLFRQTSQSLIRWLVGTATIARFEAGSTICREGEEGDAMFLIVAGEVTIAQGEELQPVQQLNRGDFFGEIALLQRSIRIASAVAVSSCEVLVIGRQEFDVLHRRSSSFRQTIRLTAELRLEANVARRADPELVWLVNDTKWPTEHLAALVVDALREVVGAVAPPRALDGQNGVGEALEAGDREGAGYVVCFSGVDLDEAIGRHVADRAGGVVYVTRTAAAHFPYQSALLHRIHHVVVPPPDGALETEHLRRDAVTLSLTPEMTGATLPDLPPDVQAALLRLGRAIAHRRVGVALGGGAAWGYAHVVLLRGLARAEIPVDLVVGVSAGSLVGAFYASQGLSGLDRLIGAKLELSAAALAAIGTSSSVDVFLRRHIPERRLEELALPFATVAVEARTGREKVFRHGPLSVAVRASCALPGVFGRPLLGGDRYLDGGVRHNVPVTYCTEADADFVIASDVVPPPRASRDMRSGLRGFALELLQINRVTDTVRSLYWLASDSGRAQAGLADALFSPDLSEFFPWDFHRADAIVERAEEQVDEWLVATQARYRAFSRTAADG